ncbi:phosphotransferase enzyme family protein [Botrytis cinerea]
MSSKVDPAILKALSLDPSSATISKHGGGGFAKTFRISGEHASLNAIHSIVPSLCPQSYAHGPLECGEGFFLATDFLDLNPRDAKSTPGYEQPQFGFTVTTCCGETKQDNSFKGSWAEFYGDNRLRGIVKEAERNNGKNGELRKLVEEVVEVVVPRLLGDGNLRGSDGQKIKPVVVHGDLWSGNHGTGRIGEGGVEEVVYDSSASWSHAEFEAGIMRMFGGFGSAFWREYHEVRPKDEPREEWEDRCLLYEL